LADGNPFCAQEIPMKSLLIPAVLLASTGLAVAGCSSNADNAADADATATTTPAAVDTPAPARHAAEFLTDAIQTNNAEIKFGQAAQDMGSTQAVKDFGRMLVDDHTKANTEATEIAQAMNVAVPTGVKPEDMAAYNMATSMTGADFDQDFANAMVKGHQKAIDMFKQEVDSGDPAQVTDFAKQTLPTLQMHLETAQSLQK
jgi:putative membrane protein